MAAHLEQLLTAVDVGKILGKHPRTVLLMAERGQLPAVRLGFRTVRFTAEDVQAYIQQHRVST